MAQRGKLATCTCSISPSFDQPLKTLSPKINELQGRRVDLEALIEAVVFRCGAIGLMYSSDVRLPGAPNSKHAVQELPAAVELVAAALLDALVSPVERSAGGASNSSVPEPEQRPRLGLELQRERQGRRVPRRFGAMPGTVSQSAAAAFHGRSILGCRSIRDCTYDTGNDYLTGLIAV